MWRGLAGVLGLWAVGLVGLRAVVIPAEQCPDVTAEQAHAAALGAADWIERSQQADGTYVYEWDRDEQRIVPGYNIVRHAGVTMSLYQLAAEGEHGYLEVADRGLAYMQDKIVYRDDWAAMEDGGGNLKIGGNSLLLAGLVLRRQATGDSQYDELMRDIGQFLVAVQDPDGGLPDTWAAGLEEPDPYRSKYATGEAFWALALMHKAFPDEGWDAPTIKVADYLALHRDEYEDYDFPPWADQWAAYGMAEMIDWPLEDYQVAYARSLAERFGFLVRAESQRTTSTLSTAIHGRQARAAGMGTWSEALDSLWRVAEADPRMADTQEAIAERAACAAGMLVERQVTADESDNPYEVGAWFTEGKTRMDDQQHALSGLIRAEAILRQREAEH